MADEFNFTNPVVVWDNRHCAILMDFFARLEKQNIRYVILKNPEGLPQVNHAKDIDILIEPGKYSCAAKCIYESYKENGISHYVIHKFEKLRCWYGFNPDTGLAIHLDLLEGFLHKGCELFSFDLFYENAYKNEKGIYVLNEVYDGLILLLHSTICYHSIKDKYALKISKIYKSNRPEMDKVLRLVLGEAAAARMIDLLEQDNYKEIARQGKYFSHASKWRIFKKKPFFTLYNICDFAFEKFLRLVYCSGKYQALMSVHAPDGTGKTTFITKLAEQLGFYYICNPADLISIYHFRPCVLPNLGAAGEKAGVMKQDKNFTVPHRAKPVGFVSSFIRMTYYWLDYVIGMPWIVRKDAQFDHITVFDRYIYDFLVDPFRARIKLPYWIRRTFARLVKQPKLVFVLDADAETIYKRKQELEPAEIERQLTEFRKLKSLGSRVHLLDATRTPDEIANEAIKIVIDKFAKKV